MRLIWNTDNCSDKITLSSCFLISQSELVFIYKSLLTKSKEFYTISAVLFLPFLIACNKNTNLWSEENLIEDIDWKYYLAQVLVK